MSVERAPRLAHPQPEPELGLADPRPVSDRPSASGSSIAAAWRASIAPQSCCAATAGVVPARTADTSADRASSSLSGGAAAAALGELGAAMGPAGLERPADDCGLCAGAPDLGGDLRVDDGRRDALLGSSTSVGDDSEADCGDEVVGLLRPALPRWRPLCRRRGGVRVAPPAAGIEAPASTRTAASLAMRHAASTAITAGRRPNRRRVSAAAALPSGVLSR